MMQAAATQAEKIPNGYLFRQRLSRKYQNWRKKEAAFLSDLGETEPGLNRLIHYGVCNVEAINFFTVGEDECRPLGRFILGQNLRLRGKIHSDIERGFIRAEIITYDELIKCGSFCSCP